jgi:hypothetical protein
MISAEDIIARLQAQCPTLASVEEPTHLETVEREADQLPAATVYLLTDTPGFVPLSGAGRQYRRRYEVRITAASDESLRNARAEIHHSLLTSWQQVDDAWSEYFYARAASNFIRWSGGEMVAVTASSLQWRDLFDLQLCDYPSA